MYVKDFVNLLPRRRKRSTRFDATPSFTPPMLIKWDIEPVTQGQRK